MECELLVKCGFFKKYSESRFLACQGLINRYCKGPEMDKCKRKEYRRVHETPPPDDMLPSGVMLRE